MSRRTLDPALKSNELLIRQLEDAGWTLWYTARRGDRLVADSDLNGLTRRALEPSKAKNERKP
jgi:hypothetical protein